MRDARGLTRASFGERHDVVECVGDLAFDAGQVMWKANGEVAFAEAVHGDQQLAREHIGRQAVVILALLQTMLESMEVRGFVAGSMVFLRGWVRRLERRRSSRGNFG